LARGSRRRNAGPRRQLQREPRLDALVHQRRRRARAAREAEARRRARRDARARRPFGNRTRGARSVRRRAGRRPRDRRRRRSARREARMIYELLYPLRHSAEWLGFLNVLRYIPFRAIAATITAMLMSFVLAPWFIRELQKKQIGQVVRSDGPESHMSKAGTP